MRLTSVRQSGFRQPVPSQLLIGALIVLLTQVLALSRLVRATPLHNPAAGRQPHAAFQGTIACGQSAFAVLRQAGVRAPEVVKLQRAIQSVYDMDHIRAGHPYWIDVTADGRLQRFVYEVDTHHRLEVERHGWTFRGRLVSIASTPQERVIHGVIRGSLSTVLVAQGEPPKMAAELAAIFTGEIDLATDLCDGDTFRLLIHQSPRGGTGVAAPRILAAELVNRGRVLRAVYYAPDGHQGA